VLTPEQTAEMLSLQAQLAYDMARDSIVYLCGSVDAEGGWYDPEFIRHTSSEIVARSIRYLDLRGLIERHPTQPWVRVREEDDALDAGKVAA